MLELLLSFLKVGISSIGGGYATIPFIQEQVVNIHHWLTMQEFSDVITISQMTPGPLAVNASTFVGIRIAGIMGAIVATVGCVAIGFVVSLTMYKIFTTYRKGHMVTILQSLKATSIGLITCAATTIVSYALFSSRVINFDTMQLNIQASIIFIVILAITRKFHYSPITLMIVSGVMGVIFYAL